jgi:hypothetical protein
MIYFIEKTIDMFITSCKKVCIRSRKKKCSTPPSSNCYCLREGFQTKGMCLNSRTDVLNYSPQVVMPDIYGIMADRISVWLIIKAHPAQDLVLTGYS